MAYQLRPASRSQAKPLIGLYAESGKGKTYSALLLARGFVGPEGRIAMIETESGRGEVYADDPAIGGYDVLSLRETFSPAEYGAAITAAEQAKVNALIIDSASHEWEGAGGVLAMAAANQAAGKKGPIVWQQPKMDHQRHFMLRLMQTPVDIVIVCMRAKYVMREVPDPRSGKKVWARDEHLSPKQSEDILFEMMVHGWIDDAHALHVTKLTRKDLAEIFVDGQPITIETGKKLAVWAHGEAPATQTPKKTEKATSGQKKGPSGDVCRYAFVNAEGALADFQNIADWIAFWDRGIAGAKDPVSLVDTWQRNEQCIEPVREVHPAEVDDMIRRLKAKTDSLDEKKAPAG